jgi:ferredoxin
MSVLIDETCINCNACVEVCPVNAISDDAANPFALSRYYVRPEKCVECVGIHDTPQCAAICPSIGCITWDFPFIREFTAHFLDASRYRLGEKNGVVKSPEFREKKYRTDIPISRRNVGEAVEKEPSR